ncbi:MAG: hypothetical protein DRP32_00515 [Thermotogae bacterium]|uniref:ArsR family transcriptional regulator n=1 Tax=Kosmotoga arenicorallina TaxID=688066 RepID=A0A7C5HSC5_9BACT|nr:metalloregulator ArsR/SmtB family transcription factor [Kosmotoga sp.]MBO8166948.1 winged helix-turn-helix transcriptional regulator [Kosmotoga sp.]RKX51146.1 MAG: hypothetical protein DRP32_00515 [Thermotogota bacterium]HHF08727.1 ArsR family transcriptional regulator [Kosmotoga arenicorallina]
MSVRLVWVELGELIAISKLITDNSRKIPNDPSGHINTGIDAFIHDIANTAAWNTRTLISTFSELGENFLLFAGEEFEDGSFITLEETIESLNNFEKLGSRFFSSVISKHFGDRQHLLKSCSRDRFLDFLQNQRVLSRSSTWFLTQLLIFPQHTREIFSEALEKLLQSYINSGLRNAITSTAHESLSILTHDRSRAMLTEQLKHLSRAPLGGCVILSIQHLLPDFISAPVKFDEGTLFLLGNSLSIELSKHNHETDLLKEFLRNLSDRTRFCILKALSDEAMYVAQLAELCGLSKATISHHLSALGKLGVLKKSNEGRKVYYSLNKDNLRKIIRDIDNAFLRMEDNR